MHTHCRRVSCDAAHSQCSSIACPSLPIRPFPTPPTRITQSISSSENARDCHEHAHNVSSTSDPFGSSRLGAADVATADADNKTRSVPLTLCTPQNTSLRGRGNGQHESGAPNGLANQSEQEPLMSISSVSSSGTRYELRGKDQI